MKLTAGELDFLTRVETGRPLKSADRVEDKIRQRVKRLGFAEVVMNPRRWVITAAGRSALAATGKTQEGETK